VKREYEEAFAEVDEILKIMPIDLLSKIPLKIRWIIKENKAQEYNIKIQEPINEQNLKSETIAILGLMYRDYISSPEEREQLQLKDQEELKMIEEELQQQYDIDNVFEKRKNKLGSNDEYSTDLVVYKEPGFIKRIFKLIKGIFKKDKF
jgi:hypothetical protein